MTERLAGLDPQTVAVGVEEEFQVVDLATRRSVPRAADLLDLLPASRFGPELQQCVLESNSHPHLRLCDLAADLAALRRVADEAARSRGLGIVAAGTAPVADVTAQTTTADPRYDRMQVDYGALVREQLICGTQVHVDVRDRDVAVAVAARVAPWLPALLALSASSPYWLGADTGYASYRTLIWRRWPTTGSPGRFTSAAEYDRTVAELVRSGVISDPGMLYFDVRPSAHLPTVELRICDSCPQLADVILLTGLFRALVIRETVAAMAGVPPPTIRPELLEAATWRAARSGLEGDLVDLVTCSPAPAHELITSLVNGLRPTLEATGDWELVSELVGLALGRGSSASRQRAAHARGGPRAAVDTLLTESREGTGWLPGNARTPTTTEARPGVAARCGTA